MQTSQQWQSADEAQGAHIAVGSSVVLPTSAVAPPREAEAVVRGEDTFLILNAAPVVRPSENHPMHIFADALESRPVRTGTVLCREGKPFQMRAVIYDFDAEDICTTDVIAEALDKVLQIAHERCIKSLALPLLGTMHGYLPEERAVQVLGEALARAAGATPDTVWLLVRAGSEQNVTSYLRGLR